MTVVATDINDNVITETITVSSGTYDNKGCTIYKLPSSDLVLRSILTYRIEDINSSHEYNINFFVSSSLTNNAFQLALVFYDNNGTVLKEQVLYQGAIGVSWENINIDFKPDTSGLGGYKTRLEFKFVTSNKLLQYYRVSDVVEFVDKDDNTSWFQKIIQAIKDLPSNISNFFTDLGASIKADLVDLGTAIDGFISDLSTDFSGFIDSLGSSISGDLDSQTQAQGGFFENLKLKLQAIGDALTETFENISADFTARFEMFKPRVFEDLHWINAMVNGASGAVNTKPEVIVKYRAVTSELFYVPSGTVYNFVVDTSLPYFKTFIIYQYYDNDDYCGVFYSTVESSYVSGDVIVLPEGYSYRFCLQLTTSLAGSSSSELSDLCNDYVKLYADEGWLNAFGRLIIKGVTSLFIPSDAFFDDVYARVLDFYESKFGIFAQTTTLFYDVLNVADDVFSTVSYDFVFPEVSVPIAGKNIVVIEETVVDIGFWLENGSFGARLYKIYQLSVWAIIIYCVLKYALRVEDVVFGTSKSISFDDNPKHTQHL